MRSNLFAFFLSWASFASLMSLLIFASHSRLKWTGPVTLIKGLSPTSARGLVTSTDYTDGTTGYTHFAWCNEADGRIWHASFNMANNLTNYIEGSRLCQNGVDIKVMGPNIIYVAYTASRKNYNGSCNENSGDGCKDIYYTYSSDGGKIWLPPKQISHAKDAVNRFDPHFSPRGSQRNGIVYKSAVETGGTTESDLRYVLPLSDQIFGSESVASFTNINVEYGYYVNMSNVMHLWTRRDKPASIIGINTSPIDARSPWKNKESPWQGYCQDPRDARLPPLFDQFSIISQCTYYDNKQFYIRIYDRGVWKNTFNTREALTDYNAIGACKSRTGSIRSVIYTTRTSNIGIMSVSNGLIKTEASPIQLLGADHSLECGVGPNLADVSWIRLIVRKTESDKISVVVYENNFGPLFVDTTEPITATIASCLKNNGYVDVTLRALKSNGMEDKHAYDSAKELVNAGINPNFYATPCVGCGGAKEQANKVCRLAQATTHGTAVAYVDVTDRDPWVTSPEKNIAFLNEFVSAIEACSLRLKFSIEPGIMTSKEIWELAMGKHYSAHSGRHLWYVNLDGKSDVNDFVPFGGWARPQKKTFKKNHAECGHAKLGLGVLNN